MCKPNRNILPSAGGFLKMLPTAVSTVALALLCSLPVSHASAQLACTRCPTDAQSKAIGVAFDLFVTRGGVDVVVGGGTIGACETLKLKANVSYNVNGIGGGIGAGFTGGNGHYLLTRRGGAILPVPPLIADATPPDMATTLVSVTPPAANACIPPPGTTSYVSVKNMVDASYTLTPADIDAGSLQFLFEFTNATPLSPNLQGQCIDKVGATVELNIFIARPPTNTVSPPTNLASAGSSASFTVTANGSGPFVYS